MEVNCSVFLTKYKLINNFCIDKTHNNKQFEWNYHFRTFYLHLKEFVTSVLRGKLICKRFFITIRFFSQILNLVLKSCFSFYTHITKCNAKETNTIALQTKYLNDYVCIFILFEKKWEFKTHIFNVYDTFLLLFRLCSMINADESMNEKVWYFIKIRARQC